MAHSRTAPALGIQELRSARALGWMGVALWCWATAALPALHAAQHAHEADRPGEQGGSHRQQIQALIEEVLWPSHGDAHEQPLRAHQHRHSQRPAGTDPHGQGAIEHLDVAFAPVTAFLVPSGFQTVELAAPVPIPGAPTLLARWLPGHPRGPPATTAR